MKKLLSVLLALLLLLTTTPLSAFAAEAEPAIVGTVSQDTVCPGDTVSLTVSMEQNPGIVCWLVQVEYDDSALTLIEQNADYTFDGGTYSWGPTTSPTTAMWYDFLNGNYINDGTMFTLTFAVNEDAPEGDYPISLSVTDEENILDQDLNPEAVAGCPPDAFSADGQLWGNPLYRWDLLEQDGYSWWIRRLGAAGKLYDMVRLDHFRGFEAFWSVPYGETTAKNGKWVKGPGMSFMNALKTRLPELDFIAEDLGFLTQEVLDLRDESGFPGMKVLEFAFDSREPSEYLPHTYTNNSVVYTGTHDNMTMRQWFETADPEAVEYATEYMNLSEAEGLVWGTIRTAMASVSDLCIIQMPDYLNLGGEARMNFPGTLSDCNWTWRAKDGIINKALAKRILNMTKLYGRYTGK